MSGLHDKVNSHYASIFGASLAIGAIGGLAQIGNGYSGFGYDPSVEIRNGMTQSMGQSSSRVLDRFLNRMPTITIREGTRVRIILTDDLQLPTSIPCAKERCKWTLNGTPHPRRHQGALGSSAYCSARIVGCSLASVLSGSPCLGGLGILVHYLRSHGY